MTPGVFYYIFMAVFASIVCLFYLRNKKFINGFGKIIVAIMVGILWLPLALTALVGIVVEQFIIEL